MQGDIHVVSRGFIYMTISFEKDLLMVHSWMRWFTRKHTVPKVCPPLLSILPQSKRLHNNCLEPLLFVLQRAVQLIWRLLKLGAILTGRRWNAALEIYLSAWWKLQPWSILASWTHLPCFIWSEYSYFPLSWGLGRRENAPEKKNDIPFCLRKHTLFNL